jgi:hypothetical protein
MAVMLGFIAVVLIGASLIIYATALLFTLLDIKHVLLEIRDGKKEK